MKLSVKFLKNVVNVNTFQYFENWDISEGSAQRLYFQIVDLHKEGIRYMSQETPLLVSVKFPSIDSDIAIEKTATQPFADDKSIWYVDLDVFEVPNPGSVEFCLDENGVVSRFKVAQAITVNLLEDGGC